MAKKIKKVKPKKINRRSLDPIREQLDILVKEANSRVERLIESNVQSRALLEAQRTFKRLRSRNEREGLFKSDLKRRRDINREYARVNQFLTDITSTPEGVLKDSKVIETSLKGAFGAQWKNVYGVNYDKSRIDEDMAKDAFRIYRQLSEEFGGWERISGIYQGIEGLIGYGSEVLINSIYDMVRNNFQEESIMVIGREMIESAERRFEIMAEKMVSDYDYGSVFSDEEAIARRSWILSKIREEKTK